MGKEWESSNRAAHQPAMARSCNQTCELAAQLNCWLSPWSARPRRPAFRGRGIVEARVQGVPPCMPDDDTMGETRSERTFQKGHTSYLSALVCARTSAGLDAPLVVCAQQRIDTASRACDPGFSQPEGNAAKRGRLAPLSQLPQSVKEFKSLVCAALLLASLAKPALVLTTRKRKAALLLEGKRWSQALRLLDVREWGSLTSSSRRRNLNCYEEGRGGWRAFPGPFVWPAARVPVPPAPSTTKEKTKHENLVDSASS